MGKTKKINESNNGINALNKEIKDLNKVIDFLNKEIAATPPGVLKIHRRKGHSSYAIVKSSHNHLKESNHKQFETYVRVSDIQTIKTYAIKKYYCNLRKVLMADLKALSKGFAVNKASRYNVYSDLPVELRQYVTPIYKPKSYICKEWESAEYVRNNYPYTEGHSYKTQKGDLVRSKNEVIVADKLYNAGIPYRYEEQVITSNGKTYYPDFKILNPSTLEEFRIEILGLMDQPGYVENTVSKLHDYSLEPWYKNLFIIMVDEHTPFDPEVIDKLIEQYFS